MTGTDLKTFERVEKIVIENKFDKNVLKYIGCFGQLFGTKTYSLSEGRQQGVKAVDVNNGSGMLFTVLLDRGMDLVGLNFKGINLSYLSSVGIASPYFYEKDGFEFLRTYHAGFLTTCGLTQVGTPNTDEGEDLGLHGRISHVPAEQVYAGTEWTEKGPVILVRGEMHQARFFGEHLVLKREIKCIPGNNCIQIHDAVTNLGHKTEPLMILYHINLGYPLLDPNAYVVASSGNAIPQNDITKSDLNWKASQEPQKEYPERVYRHTDLWKNKDGLSFIGLINETLEKGVLVKFDKEKLDHLMQWKQFGEGAYVMGLEPSNCGVLGRNETRKRGELKTIEPGQSEHYDLTIEILGDSEKIRQKIISDNLHGTQK